MWAVGKAVAGEIDVQRPGQLIGDGQSDFCVAGSVDFVFAKHRLPGHCREAGLPHAPISGFRDAIALLPRLLRGQPEQAGGPPPIDANHELTTHD